MQTRDGLQDESLCSAEILDSLAAIRQMEETPTNLFRDWDVQEERCLLDMFWTNLQNNSLVLQELFSNVYLLNVSNIFKATNPINTNAFWDSTVQQLTGSVMKVKLSERI